ncbi:DUF6612 family protein [Dictyobacter aurantiacus]|uniref:LppX_LprAFG lipoprotein n=1 Tax=Dictyobacter aurantiacus TaxID=1936993 RepID=A0A401ZDB6_9CHLR|nr:DUF6612 family protein [Dictyobacter aurantiacus]GCE04842.1 hypothetical protein KDAU_21710 [Dictyobacter aurantiacus]
MKAGKTFSFMFLCMVTLALFISACSQTTTGTNTGNNNKPSDLTAQQVLQKSADAMKKLKSSHIDVKSNTSVQAVEAKSTNNGKTPAATNVNIAMTGSGDQEGPDQQQMSLNVNSAQQTTKLAEVVSGNKVYIQNNLGKWYVLDKQQIAGVNGNMFSGVTVDQNSLLGLVQNVKLTDHGDDTQAGPSLRHLTASLDKAALQQVLTQNPQLKGSLGQQNIDTILKSAKQFNAVVDVWIDESKFYVHRTQLKLDIVADTTAISNNSPSAAKSSATTVVDLSKFDQPVTIKVPTNATPTNNPATVFGLSQ